MALTVEARYVLRPDGALLTVNEPGGQPAPRFFLGRTREGNLYRGRHDLEPERGGGRRGHAQRVPWARLRLCRDGCLVAGRARAWASTAVQHRLGERGLARRRTAAGAGPVRRGYTPDLEAQKTECTVGAA